MQKYLHDIAAWNAISVEEQERAIGRSKLDDIEMPDDVKPANSHVALNTITGPDGEERQIVRANMPFGNPGKGEFGTYYIGYAATPSVTEEMLANMFIGLAAGQHRPDPRLLDRGHRRPVLRPVRGLPRRPARAAGRVRGGAPPGRSAAGRRSPPVTAAPGDGSLGIGSLGASRLRTHGSATMHS